MRVGSITVDGIAVGTISVSLGDEPDGPSQRNQIGQGVPEGKGFHLANYEEPKSLGDYLRGGKNVLAPVDIDKPTPPQRPVGETEVPRGEQPRHFDTGDVHDVIRGETEEAKAPAAPIGRETLASGDRRLDRSRFRTELQNNPELRKKIMRIAANEQGSNPAGTTAVLESMMNRAEVRGTSLEEQARWHRAEKGGYYQMGSMGRGALENPAHREILERSLESALGGSNQSNYATDNSSGSLAARERASGAFQFRRAINGETFFSPGSAEPALRDRYGRWLQGRGGDHPQHFDVDDIRHATRGPAMRYETARDLMGGAVPSKVIDQARAVALHSGPGGVQRFMAANGYPMAGNWCGEFAADVVKSVGGHPPANPAIASNWRRWGEPTSAPMPGDIAVRRGVPTGSTGSHVTFVESFDTSKGTFVGIGGNQGRHPRVTLPISRYDFRHGNPPQPDDSKVKSADVHGSPL